MSEVTRLKYKNEVYFRGTVITGVVVVIITMGMAEIEAAVIVVV